MIGLKPIEREDLEIIRILRNHEEIFPYVREYRLLSHDDQVEWYESYRKQRRRADWDTELMTIVEDHRIVGVGGFTRIEWRNRRAEFSFFTLSRNVREPILELLRKGFHEFGFHKITWPVYSHDPRLPIYQQIFKVEAVLEEEYFWSGKFQDRIYLSLTRREFDKWEC